MSVSFRRADFGHIYSISNPGIRLFCLSRIFITGSDVYLVKAPMFIVELLSVSALLLGGCYKHVHIDSFCPLTPYNGFTHLFTSIDRFIR